MTGWHKSQFESFDQVAEAYDRFRPGYPPRLVERLINASNLPPGGRILEVGSGTGKATLPFARRGYAIHCLDAGENLVRVAQRNLKDYPDVTFEVANFESWDPKRVDFDLVMSAQAWHWLDAKVSYAQAARVLKPSGALGLIWNMYPIPTGPVYQEIQQAYRRVAPSMEGTQSYSEQSIAGRRAEIENSGYFSSVQVWRYPWTRRYNLDDYLGLLGTYSDHIALPAETRRQLYDAIAAAIQRHGGAVEKPAVAVLFVGKRQSNSN